VLVVAQNRLWKVRKHLSVFLDVIDSFFTSDRVRVNSECNTIISPWECVSGLLEKQKMVVRLEVQRSKNSNGLRVSLSHRALP